MISSSLTWCNYERCEEHVSLHDREKHLKECMHKDDIKRAFILPDEISLVIGEESEEKERRKIERLKRFFVRAGTYLCLYGLMAVVGLTAGGVDINIL